MKTEIQIRRKFNRVKKEREATFKKLYQVKKGWRLEGNSKQAMAGYEQLIAQQNGFLEALNWIRK